MKSGLIASFIVANFFLCSSMLLPAWADPSVWEIDTPTPSPTLMDPALPVPPAQIKISPVVEPRFVDVASRLALRQLIALPRQIQLKSANTTAWPEWKKHFFDVRVVLPSVRLHFFGSGKDPKKVRRFQMNVDIDPNFYSGKNYSAYTLQHSAAVKQFQNGLFLPVKVKQVSGAFMDGDEQTGMFTVTPAVAAGSDKALFLCPRYYKTTETKAGVFKLYPSNYALVEIEPSVQASAQVRALSESDSNLVQAIIQTTSNLQPPEPHEQQSYEPTAYAGVTHQLSPAVETSTAEEKIDSYDAGVRAAVILWNSENHQGELLKEVVLSVRKIQLGQGATVTYRDRDFKVEPGPCYVFLQETRSKQEFLTRSRADLLSKPANDEVDAE